MISPPYGLCSNEFIANILCGNLTDTDVIVTKIEFSGNKFLKHPEKIIDFKPNTLTNDSLINCWQKSIISEYAKFGFFWTNVSAETLYTQKQVILKFRIKENKRAKILSVNFIGNENFSSDQLAKILRTNLFFSESILKSQINALLTFYENNGFPFATVTPQNFYLVDSNKTIAYTFKINENEKVIINNTKFIGAQTKTSRLLNISGLKPNTLYSESNIKNRLKKLIEQNIEVVRSDIIKIDSSYQLVVVINDKRSQEITGALTYLPQDKEFAGFLHLNLNNLFNTLRKVNISYQNYSQFTEYRLTFLDPYLFGFTITSDLRHIVCDTLYTKTSFAINIRMPMYEKLSLYFLTGYDRVISNVANLANNRTVWLGQGLSIENRDNPIRPRHGTWFDFATQLGSRITNHQSQIFVLTNAQLKFFQPLPYSINISLDLLVKNLYSNYALSMSDSLFIGGIRTLRGYRENQFSTNRFLLARNQLSFFNNQNTSVFGFYDLAVLNVINRYQFRSGYGLGLKTISKIGTIEVDYGIPATGNILNGKIHLKFTNQF